MRMQRTHRPPSLARLTCQCAGAPTHRGGQGVARTEGEWDKRKDVARELCERAVDDITANKEEQREGYGG